MTSAETHGAAGANASNHRPRTWLTIAGVVLVALNMRAALAATGPLVPDIRDQLDLSRSAVSLLTSLPLLCFSALSAGVALLGRRIGSEWTLLLGMLGVAVGSVVRLVPAAVPLLLGTALVGAAITTANVLMPSLVKQYFERGASLVTGVYTAALATGAAATSAVSAPVAHDAGLGWQGALAAMALPALVAAAVWTAQLRRPRRPVPAVGVRVLRSRVTWALAAFMGMQSMLYYVMLAWLPTLLQDSGVSATDAGGALALFNLVGIASSLVVPTLAARRTSQVPAVLVICVIWGVALAGFLLAPAYYTAWAVVAGLAQGACISLALTLIVLRARTAEAARSLSGTVQSIGYLVAAAGPVVVGALRDLTAGWAAALCFVGGAVAVMAVSSPWSAGPRQVG